MHRIAAAALFCVTVAAIPSPANAGSILFEASGTGANGVTLNASALFTISGDVLTIKLTNLGDTSGSLSDLSANTLTGLFFDLPTDISLTPTSASIAPGDLVNGSACDVGPCTSTTTDVGGEFVYDTSAGGFNGFHKGDHGISSSGYIDGGSPNFNGPDLDSPTSPNGINFGIIAPIGYSNPFKPNGGLANDPLIEGEVVFTMAISGGTLLESQISNVSFQYGTDFKESKLKAPPGRIVPETPIPEPVSLLLLAPALGLAVRRRMRAASDAR